MAVIENLKGKEDPFYIGSCTNWVKTPWTYSINCCIRDGDINNKQGQNVHTALETEGKR